MEIRRFGEKIRTPVALALGFFDCAHVGHRAVLTAATAAARRFDCASAAFTFDNNPFAALGRDIKPIYTFSERAELFGDIGMDFVLPATFDKKFMKTTAAEFLTALGAAYDVRGIYCGGDYAFGSDGGGASELRAFCDRRGAELVIPENIKGDGGGKVSSTAIRGKLAAGDIEGANAALGAPYFVLGRVERGRGVGSKETYPTANIAASSEKSPLKEGVYATRVLTDGRIFAAVTNAGGRPTFGDGAYGIETHLIDYNNDMYGRVVRVEFLKYMRGVEKFASTADLKARIDADIASRRALG